MQPIQMSVLQTQRDLSEHWHAKVPPNFHHQYSSASKITSVTVSALRDTVLGLKIFQVCIKTGTQMDVHITGLGDPLVSSWRYMTPTRATFSQVFTKNPTETYA